MDKKEEGKEIKVKKVFVTSQLPTQEVRQGVTESGEAYEFVTIDEALSEILETVRHLKKNFG